MEGAGWGRRKHRGIKMLVSITVKNRSSHVIEALPPFLKWSMIQMSKLNLRFFCLGDLGEG